MTRKNIIEELGDDSEFRRSMWRLDVLQDPKLNVLPDPALAQADLLIISLRGEGQLPAKIHVLIGEWLAEKSKCDCALVALFEGAAPASRSSLYAHLANLARAHGLDFFEQALSDAEDHEEPMMQHIFSFGSEDTEAVGGKEPDGARAASFCGDGLRILNGGGPSKLSSVESPKAEIDLPA